MSVTAEGPILQEYAGQKSPEWKESPASFNCFTDNYLIHSLDDTTFMTQLFLSNEEQNIEFTKSVLFTPEFPTSPVEKRDSLRKWNSVLGRGFELHSTNLFDSPSTSTFIEETPDLEIGETDYK